MPYCCRLPTRSRACSAAQRRLSPVSWLLSADLPRLERSAADRLAASACVLLSEAASSSCCRCSARCYACASLPNAARCWTLAQLATRAASASAAECKAARALEVLSLQAPRSRQERMRPTVWAERNGWREGRHTARQRPHGLHLLECAVRRTSSNSPRCQPGLPRRPPSQAHHIGPWARSVPPSSARLGFLAPQSRFSSP